MGSIREVMLGRQEEIKPLGQPGKYVSFPSTSLLLPFFNEYELSLCMKQRRKQEYMLLTDRGMFQGLAASVVQTSLLSNLCKK